MGEGYGNTGITGRAWFKPLVALWFGVLAALGMWFMPPDIHNSIASGLGLSSLHPIFAAPLGANGVLVLCVAAGLIGALIGLLIAWRIAAASAPRAFAPGFELHEQSEWAADAGIDADELEQPRRRRVFSAREDIGEEGIAVTAPSDETDYEDEYTLEDEPEATPDGEFETVYADFEDDYVPAEEEPILSDVHEIESDPITEEWSAPDTGHSEPEAPPPTQPEPEYAEFEDAESEPASADHEEEPIAPTLASEPETAKPASPLPQANDSKPLGDMSLEELLGRLEGALDQHTRMVEGSERAAQEPAPRPVPLTQGQAAEPEQEPSEQGLPEAADDDPVIAFLRREANRRMPASPDGQSGDPASHQRASRGDADDAQAALRSALDRLGQTGRRD